MLPIYNSLRNLNKPLLGRFADFVLTGRQPNVFALLSIKRVVPQPASNARGRANTKANKSTFPVPQIKSLAPIRKDRASMLALGGVYSSFSKAFSISSGDSLAIVNAILSFLPPLQASDKVAQRCAALEANLPRHFVEYFVAEFNAFQEYIRRITAALHDIRAALSHEHLMTATLFAVVKVLKSNFTPDEWKSFFFYRHQWPLNSWLDQVTSVWQEWDRLSQPNFKPCSYNLSIFSNPAGFFACLQLSYSSADSNWKDLVLQADITSRDRDILREPAADGVFVHELSVYNATVELGELKEAKAHSKSSLPIVQFRFVPREKIVQAAEADDDEKGKKRVFVCPCFADGDSEPLFALKFVASDSVQVQQWSLLGVRITTF